MLTAQGKLLHERVHDEEQITFSNGMLVMRSLPLRSLRLGIYGVADVVEFKPDSQGIPIAGYPSKYAPYPVEYKRGSSKANDCDRIQMCAQALCLEEMLGLNIGEGSLFYGETRRRERVTLDSTLRGETEAICAEMRKIYEAKATPLPTYKPQCKSCSLENECTPKAIRRSARQYWKTIMDTMEDEQ